MKYIKFLILALLATAMVSCDEDDDNGQDAGPDFSGTYVTADQMGRPAINTVLIPSGMKNDFNTTVPSAQSAKFKDVIQASLEGVSPAYDPMTPTDANALGFTAEAFAGVLATDVLSVATTGKTTFFDGTNVLTGRALADDVIDTELLLIFGGEDGMENAPLTSDNVDANDKAFLTSFPYLATPH